MQRNQDRDVIRETDAEAIRLAKTLLRSARFGALAVLEPRTGAPLASRAGVATDIDGAPLILVSMLAAHTSALLADPRCSLLLGEPGKGDPLAHPRLTLVCQASRLERGSQAHARAERRYLNRNPKASLYAGLGDFSIFRLEPQRASLNGGFGKAYLLERADLLTNGPIIEELAGSEQSAVEHMNADHLDAIAIYARHFAKAPGDGWTIAGLDADGMDLVSGDNVCRVFFPQPLVKASELRPALVEMARIGRAASEA
ncbi:MULTISPECIES: HugZ family protein [unclassified Mesorhizobium]|uniref:HugZ family pyridoxamine 5'-phosphate oxidase n=1 Tax=unclassified Mesorhizobium TaxID=325217 RepID=UPI001091E92C|nr:MULTISPECIES: HugZ family protein [unclassified Mesorhizobium]TGP91116.1 HugZ family protein [Mesorhizobium sp. M8A.F.Ca.ET.218.01.1.1]TGS45074.1 HugZ family protein [Mesorhizobium sp. M8A.F.Ca.ET.182.01.1.1]TGS80774.1 HugZ family protein [Mesorhizobium sp. M8A.F.Ca.ET.181.01.1.1]TGT16847.1 HugZ family protein [Mesorhizobium sp. M8A.F.Ca.ET.213.01.1.1]TGT46361.1 HugZ family protein [Mesorhizobium sp. M8A.F.Ca.ET.165.01.1.1]